uniref:Peptidase A2 domain-containing protein n=1 Tax=Meloidogyne hapla TaxID=6305 RepID=A0A1I8B0F6_MELHA
MNAHLAILFTFILIAYALEHCNDQHGGYCINDGERVCCVHGPPLCCSIGHENCIPRVGFNYNTTKCENLDCHEGEVCMPLGGQGKDKCVPKDVEVCNEYLKFEGKANCGDNGYPIGYGLKYCNKFYQHYDAFNDDGKEFVKCVGPCLAEELQKWITESIKLNNKPVEMIVDSGSQISCINEETWKKLGSPKLSQVSYTGIGIGGTEYIIEGKVKVLVEILGKGSVEEVHIVKGQVNLMGLPWLNKFGTSSPLIRKYSKENSLNKSRMNKNLNSPEDQNCKNQNSNKFNQKHIQPQNWKKVLIKKEKPKTWQKPSQFEKDMKVLVMNRNKNGKIVWLPGTIINKVEEKWKIEVPRLKSIVSREDWQIRKPQSMKPNENYSDSVESLKTMKSSIPSQNLENSLMESRSMMKDVSKEKHSRGTKDDVEHEDEP